LATENYISGASVTYYGTKTGNLSYIEAVSVKASVARERAGSLPASGGQSNRNLSGAVYYVSDTDVELRRYLLSDGTLQATRPGYQWNSTGCSV